MQVSVEETGGLGRRMTVQVPRERVDRAIEERLKRLKGQVRLDGFRPGKVPMKVLRQRYGDRVRGEVVGEVVQQTYNEALEQEALRPAGQPHIEPRQTEGEESLEYVATFEVLPQVEVGDVSDVKVTRPAVEVTDADVDRVLERMRRQHATFMIVERAAADEDKVTIDFEGTVDGEPFEGNTGEGVTLILGAGQVPEVFEEALRGAKAGEEKTVEHTFPEGYPNAELAGKAAVFQVAVKQVEGPVYPDLDDTFAERIGVEGGIERLREAIRGNLERERDEQVRDRVKGQLMRELHERIDVELPATLVDGEIEHLRHQYRGQLSYAGRDPAEADELPAERLEEQARQRVKLGLIVNELVRREGIQLDQQKVMQRLREMAMGQENPGEALRQYAEDQRVLESVEVAVLEDQVVDWLTEQVQVEDEPMDFETLAGGGQPAAEERQEEEKE